MTSTPSPSPPFAAVPRLEFVVEGVAPVPRTAVPTLRFDVRVEAPGGQAIRAIVLETQIQIAARRRRYDAREEARLFELFGEPERWGSTLRTLLWTRVTQAVPAFTGATTVQLDVPCTYDFEVATARYLSALDGGNVPLELLFGGTLFYAAENGLLQTARVAWDREAECRMPVTVWRQAMDQHFKGTTWMRLRKETFTRLQEYTSTRALPSFDHALDELIDDREQG